MADTGTRTGTVSGTTTGTTTTAGRAAPAAAAARGRTRWVGWNIFAAVLLMLGGLLQAFTGLIAIVNDGWVVWANRSSVYLDLTAWGWTHLILGALVFLAGLGVLTGNIVARIVGIGLAALSFIAYFLFLPANPLWSLTVMVLDVLVIWALAAHGDELRPTDDAAIDLR